MKSAILVALLIAFADAKVGTDCKVSPKVCEETECCGTATPKTEGAAEKPLTICQTETLDEYVNPNDDDLDYAFACNTEEGASIKCVTTLATVFMSAYVLSL